ncbi:uncharacterized protein PG986_010603 [Apiospora aurea]|uniref:Hypervirulence associated protein TUDOR domain-containing protein n=1 Tax=Apiospora aurea TaxID=335848 RepID=A0ABR1Q2V7_9PEZI
METDKLQADDVVFKPENMYEKKPEVRADIVTKVVNSAPAGAKKAEVVNGWHTSASDKRNHCTVDYYDEAGKHITTKHIV